MRRRSSRLVPILLLAVLALVRHDLWWWDDPTRVLGMPVGLTYHVLFCFAVAAVMAYLVRVAGPWPDPDDAGPPGRTGGARPPEGPK